MVDISDPNSEGKESDKILASPDEDTPSSLSSVSNARSTPRNSQSSSLNSSETAKTSIDISWFLARKRSHPAFSKLRASLKRSISLRETGEESMVGQGDGPGLSSSEEIVHEGDKGLMSRWTEDEQHSSAIVQLAGRGAKACVAPFPKLASWMGRAMVNQQMRMFDVST
jgi:hypothetical protein